MKELDINADAIESKKSNIMSKVADLSVLYFELSELTDKRYELLDAELKKDLSECSKCVHGHNEPCCLNLKNENNKCIEFEGFPF